MIFQFLFYPVLFFLLCATFFFFYFLFTLDEKWGKAGVFFLGISLTLSFFYLIAKAISLGYFPITNKHVSLIFFEFLLILIFYIFYFRFRLLMVGVFLSPLALLLVIIAAFMNKETSEVIPILHSLWLPIHVMAAFIGNALFALSFVISFIYLIENFRLKKKRFDALGKYLPSLTMLDNINYFCIVYGFPFMTLGIITGAIWAQYAIGSYWNNDPKEIWSLITWILYAALLHLRLITGWKGKKVAIFSIIAFSILIFSFIGVTYIFKGYHSFKS
ncbi:MAG: c-type cytochrome biogenesis protein CcsB [bacterium]